MVFCGVSEAEEQSRKVEGGCYICAEDPDVPSDQGLRLKCSHAGCSKLLHPNCALKTEGVHIETEKKGRIVTYTCYCEVSLLSA